jgi:DNA-binding transcriptional LysR family regulator
LVMLDVRRLRVLREVAKQGSFSAAASSLGYTQPAVSRQISVLEGETGVQLLRRMPQGVALTEAGRLLVERTEDVISRLDRIEDELRAHSELEGGRLRLSAFASAAAGLLPLALVRFRERHPAVELSVIVLDPIDSLPLLRADELDIALCNYTDPNQSLERSARANMPSWAALDAVPLFEDPMYVALPAGHPLADARRLKLADLADDPWMLTTTTTCPDSEIFRIACKQAGVEPPVAFEYDDYAALLGFVAASVGVAVVPDMVARNLRDGVVLRELDPPLPARPVVAAVASGYRSPAVAAMLDILLELAAEWEGGRVGDTHAQPIAA